MIKKVTEIRNGKISEKHGQKRDHKKWMISVKKKMFNG